MPKFPQGFRKLSISGKIVWLFQHMITEAHRAAICSTIKITEEQFDQAIASARELGITGIDPLTGKPAVYQSGKNAGKPIGPIHLTAVYERGGWWTGRPTQRLVAFYLRAALDRNLGEAERNERVYSGAFGKVGRITIGAAASMAAIRMMIVGLRALTVSAKSDYVLNAIDTRPKPNTQLFVRR
jgi:hypothetical protein